MADRIKPYSRIILFGLKAALYALLFLSFFLILSITNPQLLRISRTAGITMSTYAVLTLVLSSIYGGYQIGRQKSKTIIYSMSLAAVVTDVVAYIQLQIMNVNDANNETLQLLGVDLALLAGIIVLQVLIIIAFAYFGNYLFFRINPPEKCVIITSSRQACRLVADKVGRYKLQYEIAYTSDYRSADVYVKIMKCDTVFLYEVPIRQRRDIVEFCYKNGKNVNYQMDIMDVIEASAEQVLLDDMPYRSYTKSELSIEQRFIKRTIDIVFSSIALVVTSPLLLIGMLTVLIMDGRPVFFRQARLTRGGKQFSIIKLRTMKLEGLPDTAQVSVFEDDVRITRSGKFLRRTRLDELPQLINVLKGEMSLVGPRPEMLENVDLYTRELPEFSYRLKVKAGLTGHAQIAGRYNTKPKDKLVMDMMYIENYSLWDDLKLMIKTPIVFLRPDSAQGFKKDEDEKDKDEEDGVIWFDQASEKRRQKHTTFGYPTTSKGDIGI